MMLQTRRVTCSASPQQGRGPLQQQQRVKALSRRQALYGLAGAGFLASSPPSQAVGIESVDLPSLNFEQPNFVKELSRENQAWNQATLEKAEESFQNSELLRTLKERTEANKDKYKRELQDRYCRRQAELGVGDCGGLRYIPGMTKSGVQKRPEWLEGLLGGSADE